MTSDMNHLEEQLATLTEPSAPSTSLWKHAVESRPTRGRVLLRRSLAAAACVAVVSLIIGLMFPAMGGAFHAAAADRNNLEPDALRGKSAASTGHSVDAMHRVSEDSENRDAFVNEFLRNVDDSGDAPGRPASQTAPFPAPRQIIRTADIRVQVDDLDAAFETALMVPRSEFGEYIQSSDIGDRHDPHRTRATIVFRITANRIDEASRGLRGLGTVTREVWSSQDATDRLTDLEARLVNARQLETELRELIASRENADLSDIMLVRRELSSVRLEIERLDAQRANLRDRVAYSTITLTLYTEEEEIVWEPGLGWRFTNAFSEGLEGVISVALFAVRAATTLAPFIVMFGLVVLVAWWRWRKRFS